MFTKKLGENYKKGLTNKIQLEINYGVLFTFHSIIFYKPKCPLTQKG